MHIVKVIIVLSCVHLLYIGNKNNTKSTYPNVFKIQRFSKISIAMEATRDKCYVIKHLFNLTVFCFSLVYGVHTTQMYVL